MPEPAPLPDENGRALSRDELAIVRRAYARQMLAILGVDNPAIEAAYAAVRARGLLRAAAVDRVVALRRPSAGRR